jgi:pimeloyl-ACP methyl ester carboxylesterase
MTRFLRLLAALGLAALMAACSPPVRPDLERLYEVDVHNDAQPPIILIHGLMGSTLVERGTGKEFWPGSIGSLAFSEYRELARMRAAEDTGGGLVPGDLFYGVARTDYYGALTGSLESVGRFKRGIPGEPVGDGDRRRYYVLLYDWRKENLVAVGQLHQMVEQIRRDYGDPNLRVDILAHSNGGLIANYYLRYGPNDVLTQGALMPWDEGAKRIRRMVLLGTPSLGAVTSLDRLQNGFKIAWRTVPVEVLATFATPYEALPHPDAPVIYSPDGKLLDFDFYDPENWRSRRWSVFSPEVEARVLDAASDPASGALAMAELQALFVRHLVRAKRFQQAVSSPLRAPGVQIAVFGGDCTLTPGRAVLDRAEGRERLVIRPEEVQARVATVDYERLMLLPGDSLVTRESQLGTGLPDRGEGPRGLYPAAQSFFLCETHDQLSVNPYFQNNLLKFLLAH